MHRVRAASEVSAFICDPTGAASEQVVVSRGNAIATAEAEGFARAVASIAVDCALSAAHNLPCHCRLLLLWGPTRLHFLNNGFVSTLHDPMCTAEEGARPSTAQRAMLRHACGVFRCAVGAAGGLSVVCGLGVCKAAAAAHTTSMPSHACAPPSR